MRAHKIIMEAFSRVLFEQFEHWLESERKSSFQDMMNGSLKLMLHLETKTMTIYQMLLIIYLKRCLNWKRTWMNSSVQKEMISPIATAGVHLQYMRAERDVI